MVRRTESCRHVYRKERSATGQPDRIWETLQFEFLQRAHLLLDLYPMRRNK